MATFAFVPHRGRPEAVDLARSGIKWLTSRGHECRVGAEDAAETGMQEWSVAATDLTEGLDLAVSVGGDGTMLRAVDLVCSAGVPLLGVNVGHLGYLTEVEPDQLESALEKFLAGSYAIEERMTLDVEIDMASDSSSQRLAAFNELVLEKTEPGNTVAVGASIGGRPFLTYAADGLIVATPTGSTAYNLSARGPIVSPKVDAMLLTPVSPHMLFDRTLVVHPSEPITLEVLEGPDASVVVDGKTVAILRAGDKVTCRAGALPARLVTFGGRDFHRILRSKFGLVDR